MLNPQWYCVAGVVLAALAAGGRIARAETCTLELKRLDVSPDARESQIYQATSSQSFSMQFGTRAYRPPNADAEFREIVKKEPERYVAKEPFRGVARLGSGGFAFVLDAKDEKSKGYDRLYFDLNGNGDLTDDKPIDSVDEQSPGSPPVENYVQRQFPRVDLKIPIDGQSLDYAFRFSVYWYSASDYRYASASLAAAAYRVGVITLEGQKREVALLDYNGNGRFDDQITIPGNISYSGGGIYAEMGDVLLVDVGQAPRPATQDSRGGEESRQYVSKLAKLGDGFYDLKISPAGDQLTLTPSTLKIGYVTNANGPFEAMIYGDRGFLAIRGEAGKPLAIPEGEWRLLSYSISVRDWKPPAVAEKGAESPGLLDVLAKALIKGDERREEPRYGPPGVSTVQALGTTSCKPVAVRDGETVTLPFGPPYKSVVEAGLTSWAGSAPASLSLSLVGTAGEAVSNVVVDGYRPPKPEFTITNPKGEVVEKGTFEYG